MSRITPPCCKAVGVSAWVVAAFAVQAQAPAPAAAPQAPHAVPAALRQVPHMREALQRAGIPDEALAFVVQEAANGRTLLEWQGSLPLNPASLAKLVTTQAALERLGPGWSWATPVWVQGSVQDGVLQGDVHIKGSGDPKLVHERLWLLLRRLMQFGVRDIRGDVVLDNSAFAVPDVPPGEFDGEPLRPYNVRPAALLLNYRAVVYTFTPDVAAGVARVGVEPALARSDVQRTVPLAGTPCNDWRGALDVRFMPGGAVPPGGTGGGAATAALSGTPSANNSATAMSTAASTAAASPEVAPAALPTAPPTAASTANADARPVTIAATPTPTWRVRFDGRYPQACGEQSWAFADAEPSTYDQRLLEGLWREMGGSLSGRVREGAAPGGAKATFEHRSPALAEVVRDINKYSNNVMAEQLALTLAREAAPGAPATPEAARMLLQRWLSERVGAATAAGAVLSNGSGLSRESRLSPRQLARLLVAAHAGPTMPELLASLPVAAVDGTARSMRGAPGRAHLKTGSLRDVYGIAGYVLAADGRRLVLAALINHPQATAARPALEALVQWVHSRTPSTNP